MFKCVILAGSLAVMMAGCAVPPPISSAEWAEADAPIYCEGKEQCDFMWRRAQVFVAAQAGYKIQTATDVVIETFNAPRYSSSWAFRVMREPVSPNKDRISIYPSCGELALCQETAVRKKIDFARYMANPSIKVTPGPMIETRKID